MVLNGWFTEGLDTRDLKEAKALKYDEHQELDVPEDRYRARGYQPSFEELPWKDEAGEAANAPRDAPGLDATDIDLVGRATDRQVRTRYEQSPR
jgi:hypothetical protein